MSRHAFFLKDSRVYHVANPCGAGLNYQARELLLAPGDQTAPGQHLASETTIVVTAGQLEVMINGASSVIETGGFARIAPGLWFAVRNPGAGITRLLVRIAPQPATPRPRRFLIEIAAA